MPKNEFRFFRERVISFFVYVFLIFWGIIQLFPLYYMITLSLKTNNEIFAENILGLPLNPRWSNYVDVFTISNLGRYLLNSVSVTFMTIAITVVLCLMMTFAIVRMRHRWKGRLTAFILFGLTVPAHAALVPIFILLRDIKLINTHAGLLIPYVGFAIPITFLIFSGFMEGIPKELDEAATIDGCNAVNIFIRIICPLMAGAIATACIFIFLSTWNELMFALVYLSDESLKTLTVGLQGLRGQHVTDWGMVGTGMVVGALPIIAFYILVNKKVQESLIVGAVKG